jgi:hypothetical protein
MPVPKLRMAGAPSSLARSATGAMEPAGFSEGFCQQVFNINKRHLASGGKHHYRPRDAEDHLSRHAPAGPSVPRLPLGRQAHFSSASNAQSEPAAAPNGSVEGLGGRPRPAPVGYGCKVQAGRRTFSHSTSCRRRGASVIGTPWRGLPPAPRACRLQLDAPHSRPAGAPSLSAEQLLAKTGKRLY